GAISAARTGAATLRGTTAALTLGNLLDISSSSGGQTFTLGGTQGFTLNGPVVFDTTGATLAVTTTGTVATNINVLIDVPPPGVIAIDLSRDTSNFSAETINVGTGLTVTVADPMISSVSTQLNKTGLGKLNIGTTASVLANPNLVGPVNIGAGTVSVTDPNSLGPTSNNSQQFSVAPQPGTSSGNVNQVQRLVITAPGGLATAGGTFTLSYGAGSTQSQPVAFSPTPTSLRQNVQSALGTMFGGGATPNATATLVSSPTDPNQVVIDIT